MKIIIEDKEWILTPLEFSKRIIESPSGDKYIKLDAYLLKKLEEEE